MSRYNTDINILKGTKELLDSVPTKKSNGDPLPNDVIAVERAILKDHLRAARKRSIRCQPTARKSLPSKNLCPIHWNSRYGPVRCWHTKSNCPRHNQLPNPKDNNVHS